jgi:ABC-type sugar transport system ATPase subunit
VLLLDEPTRGIDVGAKAEIYAVVRRLADDGMSVIVVSSDLEEVIDLSDRVLVMHAGRKLAELAGEDATVKRVLDLVFKVEEVPA